MGKRLIVLAVIVVCASMVLIGCGANKESSSQAAIQKSQTIATAQQKIDYLAGQAKAFINSKEFDQAVSVAQYILNNIDNNSQIARSLLEKAKTELAAQAKAKMAEAKSKLGF
jgi:hypothetical protein